MFNQILNECLKQPTIKIGNWDCVVKKTYSDGDVLYVSICGRFSTIKKGA